jgi:nucleoid-associated protein YgaU
MERRRGTGLLAGLILTVAAGALVACGGASPLDIAPTSTAAATAVSSQPTQPPAATATAEATNETPATGGQQEYVVQDGDTLGAIAEQFGVTVDAIVQANSITDANLIIPGETLIIPAPQ